MTHLLQSVSRMDWTGRAALAAFLVLGFANGAAARTVVVSETVPALLIHAEAPAPDKVRLLLGLGEIRADLQQAMLAEGPGAAAHFVHARAEVWSGVKEAMLAAGVADLEPVLQKLESGGGKDALRKGMVEAEAALQKARSVLAPTDADVVQVVTALAQGAAGRINASGPTGAQEYQAAWGFLMAARGELDLLARSADPGMAKLAMAEAMAIDEMLISLPDPAAGGAVRVDPTPILDLIGRLQKPGGAA